MQRTRLILHVRSAEEALRYIEEARAFMQQQAGRTIRAFDELEPARDWLVEQPGTA